MENRYLFRAKQKKWRELPKEKWWVEGYYAYMKPYHCIMPKDNFDSWIGIDEKTLCQCTGLTDKSGKLIWENDIIKYHFGSVYAPIKYGEYKSCFDSTSTGHIGFYVDWKGTKKENMRKDLGYWINMISAKVVGNIFDNPELLEK